jgi:hypothetical protein
MPRVFKAPISAKLHHRVALSLAIWAIVCGSSSDNDPLNGRATHGAGLARSAIDSNLSLVAAGFSPGIQVATITQGCAPAFYGAVQH